MSDPSRGLAGLVEQARAAIAGTPIDAGDGPLVGTAAGGQVVAELGTDGRLRSLEIDPVLMRRAAADVAAAVVVAVNDALDQRPDATRTGPLLDQLREVQERSVRELAEMSQAFTTALASIRRD